MDPMVDMARIRRETLRWLILLTLNNARPLGAMEMVVLSVVQATYPDATPMELRRELDICTAESWCVWTSGQMDPGTRS